MHGELLPEDLLQHAQRHHGPDGQGSHRAEDGGRGPGQRRPRGEDAEAAVGHHGGPGGQHRR